MVLLYVPDKMICCFKFILTKYIQIFWYKNTIYEVFTYLGNVNAQTERLEWVTKARVTRHDKWLLCLTRL